MGETRRCSVCSDPIRHQGGPGRPPAYCGVRCRKLAERKRAADRVWAARDRALDAFIGDLDVPELDVDQVNAELNRMR